MVHKQELDKREDPQDFAKSGSGGTKTRQREDPQEFREIRRRRRRRLRINITQTKTH